MYSMYCVQRFCVDWILKNILKFIMLEHSRGIPDSYHRYNLRDRASSRQA